MKYKLLKDLPGYEAGTIFEKDDELPIRKQAMTSRGKNDE